MLGRHDQPLAKERSRGRLDSLTEMPTNLITLSPAFLEALRKVAPKVRPRRLPYVLTLVAVVSIGIVSGRRILANHDGASAIAPAPPAASAAPAPKTVDAVAPAPSTLRPEFAATNAAKAPASPPAADSMTISVDALPRATTPKATKIRHSQATR
jgi:hypothetical protein